MRMKIELVLIAMFIAITWRMAYADGVQWKCQGAVNCKAVNCYDAALEGHSCALVTAVIHPKCAFTGSKADKCTNANRQCARVDYYSGGACDNNNAPYCDLNFPDSMGYDLTEEGCNP